MIGRVNLWVVCGVLLGASVCASRANAQFMSGGGYGLGFFNYSNNNLMVQRPPYYALYPPVYYSYPVARTYGYSPFAYPPGTMTPNVAPKVKSVMYHNPFVPRKAEPVADTVDKSVRRDMPLGKRSPVQVARIYINPFAKQAGAASTESLTARVEP